MKYEFTGKVEVRFGISFRQIRRLIDGLIGGWIENEKNLSQDGNAWVYGNARVYGNAAICMFSGFGSANRTTTAYRAKAGIEITCGCFHGSLAEFRAQVERTYGEGHKHRLMYLGMADMIEVRLADD